MKFIDPKLIHCTDYTHQLDYDIPNELEINDSLKGWGGLNQTQETIQTLSPMTLPPRSQNIPNLIVSIKVDSNKLIRSIQKTFTPLEVLKQHQRYIGSCDKKDLDELSLSGSEEDKENIPPPIDPKNYRWCARLYSRCSIQELAKVLNLHQFHIILTKKVELDVLKTFERYCNFQLGTSTWVRTTTAPERVKTVQTLYRIFHPIYGLDPAQLEIILRRGTYKIVQSRRRSRHQ